MKRTLFLVLLCGACVWWAITAWPSAVVQATPLMQPRTSWSMVSDPGELRHPATISAATIDAVLRAAQSPAAGLGSTLVQLGVHYGIDPVFALAFFAHESSFGRFGVARATRGLGNIRCSDGYVCLDGYRAYRSWAAGAQDWYQLLSTVYLAHGLHTVATIIPVYAPAADDNDEGAYIASVLELVQRWRTQGASQ